jgi:hypothetical protein
MPRSAASAVELGPQRRIMADQSINYMESMRNDYFPDVPSW